MTRAFAASCGKEIRALLLPSIACAAAIGAASRLSGTSVMPVAVALTAGAIVIGAWTIGHEYSGRTLALLLTQPIGRPLLFLSKFGVSAAMIATLAGVSAFVLPGSASPDPWTRLALPLLAGLGLAPALTMICRSPLAGSVFTVAILAAAWASGAMLSAFGYGPPPDAPIALAAFRLTIVSRVVVSLSPIAAATGWLLFLRLEAVDGGERHVSLAGWFGGSRTSATAGVTPSSLERRPLWQLTRKELHLQQMTFIVAALYVLLWLANELVARQSPVTWLLPIGSVTILYCGMIAVLAGSLASAEERQYGTLDWQLLQPIASWKQWTIKAGTALGLTAALGLALPMALALIDRSTNDLGFSSTFIVIVCGACLAGLYVSSFSTSGVRALLISVLLLSVMAIASTAATRTLTVLVFGDPRSVRATADTWWLATHYGSPVRFLRWVNPSAVVLLLAAVATALWRLALTNHRSADRSPRMLPRQTLWLGAAVILAVPVVTIADGAVNRLARKTVLEYRNNDPEWQRDYQTSVEGRSR